MNVTPAPDDDPEATETIDGGSAVAPRVENLALTLRELVAFYTSIDDEAGAAGLPALLKDFAEHLRSANADEVTIPMTRPGHVLPNGTIRNVTLTITKAELIEIAELYMLRDVLRAESPPADIEKQRQHHAKGQFADRDSLMTFSAKPFHVLIHALLSPDKWERPPEDFPHYREKDVIVSLRGEPLRGGASSASVAELNPVFDNIVDPKTVILYAACMDLWIRARQSGRGLTSGGAVRIHVNDLCELFKYTKHHKGGYRLAQKMEFSKRLNDLDQLMAHGRYIDEKGYRRVLRGSYADVTFDDIEDLFENTLPYEYIVKPGEAMWDMVANNPQLMTVYTALAPLIARGGKYELAGQIGVYLCGLFRNRQATQSFREPVTIKTVLGNSCITDDASKAVRWKHYARFRESVDEAFDLLRGKVISGWEYFPGDEEGLPDRGWFKPWLQSRVIFDPMPDVIEQAQHRAEAQQRHLKGARRRRAAVG